MKSLVKILSSITLSALSFVSTSNSAKADDLYIWAEEIGGSVIFHYAGSVDLTGFPAAVPTAVNGLIDPVDGRYFNTAPGGSALQAYANVMPGIAIMAFGAGGNTAASSAAGDAMAFDGDSWGGPAGYVSGSNISGSMTFAGETFASLGVTPTPKTFNTLVGSNTFHLFTIPPTVPDLQIGKSFSKLKGDDVYESGKPSGAQSLRLKSAGKFVARVLMENDGATEKTQSLRSKGDSRAKVKAKATLPDGSRQNVSASIKTGKFSPSVPGGQSVQVTYKLKPIGGPSSAPPKKVRFKLTSEGVTDNVLLRPKRD